MSLVKNEVAASPTHDIIGRFVGDHGGYCVRRGEENASEVISILHSQFAAGTVRFSCISMHSFSHNYMNKFFFCNWFFKYKIKVLPTSDRCTFVLPWATRRECPLNHCKFTLYVRRFENKESVEKFSMVSSSPWGSVHSQVHGERGWWHGRHGRIREVWKCMVFFPWLSNFVRWNSTKNGLENAWRPRIRIVFFVSAVLTNPHQ